MTRVWVWSELTLIEIVVITLAIAWSLATPQGSIEVLILATLPWLVRLVEGKLQWRSTRIDGLMLLFMLSALMGLWATYDRTLGWGNLSLLIVSVILFYVATRRSLQELHVLNDLLSLLAVGLVGLLLLNMDWLGSSLVPAPFDRVSAAIMRIQPILGQNGLNPNKVGGVAAVFLPLSLASFITGSRQRIGWLQVYRLVISIALLVGLFLTGSRGAWFGLLVGFLLGLLWFTSELLIKHFSAGRAIVILVLLASIFAVWMLTIYINDLPAVMDAIIPGDASAQSRARLATEAMALLEDYPLTGSGLGSFPAQYSRYIYVTSELFFSYAHNLYLDIAISQSVFGAVAFVGIMMSSLWVLMRKHLTGWRTSLDGKIMRAAVLASIISILIHGLVDDAFYAGRTMVFLFYLPGIAFAFDREQLPENAAYFPSTGKGGAGPHKLITFLTILISLGLVLLLSRSVSYRQLKSKWISNFASLEFSRIDLEGFPGKVPFQIVDRSASTNLQRRFERAIVLNPVDRTAHHRLGLISLSEGNFNEGISHLEAAYASDPQHRGVIKTLGYAYVWVGEYQLAAPLLEQIPEASNELNLYADWWELQAQDLIAEHAAVMQGFLAEQ